MKPSILFGKNRRTYLILIACSLMVISCAQTEKLVKIVWYNKEGKPSQEDAKPQIIDSDLDTTKYCWIRGNTVNVRKEPTTDSEILAKVHRADRAVFLGEEGDWIMITWSNGDTVFVHKSLVSFEEIIKEGSSFL